MKILVVDPNQTDRTGLVNTLVAEKHAVDNAKDAALATIIFHREKHEVVIIDASYANAISLVKQIRANETSSHAWIVMTCAKPFADVKQAFYSGADDFLRKPVAREELLARVNGMNRIRQWAACMLAGAVSIDLSAVPDITSSLAWESVDAAISADIRDLLGTALSIEPDEESVDVPFSASLPLTLAEDGIEVRVSASVDRDSSRRLAGILLGDEGADDISIRDMLREIVNVAAGCFKRVSSVDGYSFTTGLPSDSIIESTPRERRKWRARIDATTCIRFEVALYAHEKKRIRVIDLAEGMVVAHDIINAAGALLMRGGTRLTETHLKHLPRVLAEDAFITVADVAA